jgi:hypothetical protein
MKRSLSVLPSPAASRSAYECALGGMLDEGAQLVRQLLRGLQMPPDSPATQDQPPARSAGEVEAWLKCLRLLEQTGHAFYSDMASEPGDAGNEKVLSRDELIALMHSLQTVFGKVCE